MANTTFLGPVRSQSTNGFQSVTIASGTGTETTFGKLMGVHLQIDASSAEQKASDLIVGKNGSPENTVNPFAESATQLFPIGSKLIYGDRTFRYAQMDGAVTAGKCVQSAAAVANHRDIAVQAAAAAGDTSVTVTLGSTAATLNQYANGYLHINDVAGQGQLLGIASNPAADASANVVITLFDAVATALTTSSKADLIVNSYKDVVVAPATETGPVIGVTTIDMTDDYYGWIQTNGPASVLTSGTLVLGETAVRSDTTAGAAEPLDADVETESTMIGQVMVVNGDTDNSVIWLNVG
jgi:hypothetical protein|tara:strand:+ start:2862 stop:3749 length:888 start_codon:yes stop_codon:yes gene_type:complete